MDMFSFTLFCIYYIMNLFCVVQRAFLYQILDHFAGDDETGHGGDKGDAAGDLAADGAFPLGAFGADAVIFAAGFLVFLALYR